MGRKRERERQDPQLLLDNLKSKRMYVPLTWEADLEEQWTEHHWLTDSHRGKGPTGGKGMYPGVRTAPVDKHFQKARGRGRRRVFHRKEPT